MTDPDTIRPILKTALSFLTMADAMDPINHPPDINPAVKTQAAHERRECIKAARAALVEAIAAADRLVPPTSRVENDVNPN